MTMDRPSMVAERKGTRRPAGTILDFAIVGLLALVLMAILLVFFRDQIATILAWITSLIG
jgi:hypothetical protein